MIATDPAHRLRTSARPPTCGVASRVRPSSENSGLIAERTSPANQESTACPTWQDRSKNPHPGSAGWAGAASGTVPGISADQGLEHGHDDRRQDRQPVADGGRLQRGLGLLHLGRVAAGHQVPQPADRQEQGRDRGEDPDDPGGGVADHLGDRRGGQDRAMAGERGGRREHARARQVAGRDEPHGGDLLDANEWLGRDGPGPVRGGASLPGVAAGCQRCGGGPAPGRPAG